MDRLQALKVFVMVAQAESFTAGARTLGLSGSSATRAINELEESLKARLFTRTTRRVRLTEVGRDFLEEVRDVLAQLQAAESAVTGAAEKPAGQLRITCPQELGRIYIAPLVAEFLEAFPEVSAQLLLVDRNVNLVEEGYDAAVRIGDLPSSGLTALRVGAVRRVLCGSPEYFSRFGQPLQPADLGRSHRLILTGATRREWRFGHDQRMVVRVEPRLVVNSVAASIEIARKGWGICRALSYQVADDVEAGRLVLALEDHEPSPAPVQIVYPQGRKSPAKLRAFIDFASERLRKIPALRLDGR
ncbi:LysR substrate-binding domain-containing protein [Nitratireductor basaltis]|uniref:Transcriptional regulator n=1 Tax=Nitratireductor basaltis TaxID=472175 RepID=A0A084U8N1_9HYPH|nr:LysR substrate-binding domain-containing protein [Nitratireductor basaltis]KFB09317.1 Transcriptional regulator [Nitratireductor basaltis]